MLSTAYAQSFPSNGWRALLLLLSWCPWWMAAVGCRAGGGGLNKLVGFGGDQDLIHVTLGGHFGGGQMGSPVGSRFSGKVTDAACWSSHMAANGGCCDLWLRWWPIHTPVQLLRLCVSSSMWWFKPSLGQVVSCAVVGCCASWRFSTSGNGEDEGPDGVSTNLCRVLFARNLGQVVLHFFIKVLCIL